MAHNSAAQGANPQIPISHFLAAQPPDRFGTRLPLPGPVLYFAPKECWPPSTGAQLRNFYLSRELSLSAHVTYLGFADGKKEMSDTAKIYGPALNKHGRLITVPLERGYTPLKIMKGAVGRTPLPVLNYTTRQMTEVLEQLLQEQDFAIVQVEGIHLADYLPIIRAARSKPLVVCDWHNVESELMWRYSEHAPVARRIYARTTAKRMEQMEHRIIREFDAHLVCTERDRQHLLQIAPKAPVFVIENGVNVEYFSNKRPPIAPNLNGNANSNQAAPASQDEQAATVSPPKNRLVFSGSMDYHANIDAVTYFAREVWPSVWAKRTDLIFTIVGRSPSEEVQALASIPGIEVTGRVQDVRPFYREAIAAVVPLRIGGGSRLKILEAMAAGLPVVSTKLGAEGLAITSGEDIIIATTAEDFSHAILEICDNEARRQKLVENARRLMLARYDWPAIGA
ncbi:MAG: glycosyltransferase, partial [Abitibacteriaceae bacterium]|nr:glycosyltransferase [Abditibacteriaceae bacterium]